jgi:hypothetical protein
MSSSEGCKSPPAYREVAQLNRQCQHHKANSFVSTTKLSIRQGFVAPSNASLECGLPGPLWGEREDLPNEAGPHSSGSRLEDEKDTDAKNDLQRETQPRIEEDKLC